MYLTLGVVLYYILYYYILLYIIIYYYYILLYYYILYIYIYYYVLYIILYYTLLFLFPSLPFLLPLLSAQSIFQSSISLFLPLPFPSSSSSSDSFYTCRHLDPLIYTILFPPFPSSNLTPHVLSEWMVEVCAGDLYPVLFLSWCRFYSLESCWMFSAGVCVCVIYYTILFSSSVLFFPFLLFLCSPLPSSSSFIFPSIFLSLISPPLPFPSSPSPFPEYLSVLGYTYLCSHQQSDPACFIGVDG